MTRATRTSERPRFGSLFSGCGGLDLGFLQAGMQCVAAFDSDPLAVLVHRQNLKSPADVVDLNNPNLDISCLKNLDVLLAGPPCQAFSTMTMDRRALPDARRPLLLLAGKIALLTRPKVFLVENVMGLVSSVHKKWWSDLEDMLRGGGYRTHEMRCNSNMMGVPQRRRRVFMFSWRTRTEPRFETRYVPGGELASVLRGLRGVPNHHPTPLKSGSEELLIAKHIRPGQKLCNVRGGKTAIHTWQIPEVFGRTTAAERRLLGILMRLRRQIRTRPVGDADPVERRHIDDELGFDSSALLSSLMDKGFVRRLDGAYDLVRTFNGKYRRLRGDQPSLTVDTRFIDPRYFLHPSADRGFTVREAARIQGFPDSFIFEGDGKDEARLIGNAVPPPQAHILARYVRTALLLNG